MEENIISPWFIYLVFNIDSFITLMIVPCVLSGITLAACVIGAIILSINMGFSYEGDVEYAKKLLTNWVKVWKRHLKYLIPIFTILLFIAVAVPNKNTLIAIYIADQLTWKKVEKTMEVTNGVKNNLKKDIIDIIETITKNKTELKK